MERVVKRVKSAGDIVETNCTKCRALMNHTIVAMVGEVIVRVECNTCHSTHKYHPPKEAKAPRTPAVPRVARGTVAATPRREKKDPVAEAAAQWDALQATIDPDRAVPYDMNAVFRAQSIISHPTFGLGIVQQKLPPNKMEVLFKEGRKLLRCG
jgi:hypothetical protein